jgi:hypothetical protein
MKKKKQYTLEHFMKGVKKKIKIAFKPEIATFAKLQNYFRIANFNKIFRRIKTIY